MSLLEGEEDKCLGVGKSWLLSNLEKGYFQQKDEVLWPCHAPRLSGKATYSRQGGRKTEER